MAQFATTLNNRRGGDSLILALVVLAVFVILIGAIYDFSEQGLIISSHRVRTQAAIQLGESGIEKAVWCLNNPGNTTNCPGNPSYTGETLVIGGDTVEISVSGVGNNRAVTATATKTGTTGSVTKTLRVTLTTTNVGAAFQYGVQAGIGGIQFGNNAFIDGNIFSSGSVSGGNGSYITGDAILTASAPTPDAVSDPSVSPLQTVTFADSGGHTYLAQQFKAQVTERVFSIDLKVAKHNTPTSSVTLYLYDDNSGQPGTNLSGGGQALSVGIPADSPAGWENGWTSQNYSPTTVLVEDQTYWLVLRSSANNSTRYWVSASGDDGTYGDGSAKLGSTLASLTPACAGGCDIAFRINLGGITPTLDLPSVEGNAYANKMNDITVDKKAYYNTVISNVEANGGSETCTNSSNGPNCFSGQSDQTPENFPISEAQITQMEAQAALGGTTVCSPTCVIPVGSTIGPRKYVGDVVMNGNGTVYMAGNLWVVGTLTIENNTALRLIEGYAGASGTVIADDPSDRANKGKIILSNNGDLINNSTPGSYIMAVSMNADPAFAETAIQVTNNLTAGILFAPFGKVEISNNASLREVTGQKIVLQPNASVVYESGLANVIFSSGPGGSWTYQRGTYTIDE